MLKNLIERSIYEMIALHIDFSEELNKETLDIITSRQFVENITIINYSQSSLDLYSDYNIILAPSGMLEGGHP